MTCRELAEFIADYFAGDLTPGVRGSFETHLSRCPNCRRYLAQYRATVDAGRAAFADPGAPAAGEVPEDLVRAILAARDARRG